MHVNGRRDRLAGTALAAAAALVLAVVIAGCGGDDKPGYCDALSDLQQSINDFSVAGGISGIQSQVTTIEGQAKTLVADIKSDYAAEARTIQSSLDTMRTEIGKLPSPPTVASLAGLQPAAQGVVDAVTGFANATKSKC